MTCHMLVWALWWACGVTHLNIMNVTGKLLTCTFTICCIALAPDSDLLWDSDYFNHCSISFIFPACVSRCPVMLDESVLRITAINQWALKHLLIQHPYVHRSKNTMAIINVTRAHYCTWDASCLSCYCCSAAYNDCGRSAASGWACAEF